MMTGYSGSFSRFDQEQINFDEATPGQLFSG